MLLQIIPARCYIGTCRTSCCGFVSLRFTERTGEVNKRQVIIHPMTDFSFIAIPPFCVLQNYRL